MTTTDRIRARLVRNQVRHVHQHLEAMQRDVHGLEFSAWKREVDALWKRIFGEIGHMGADLQQSSLKLVREPWTSYLTHHA